MKPLPFFLTLFLLIGVLAPRRDAPSVRIERISFDAPGADDRTDRSLNGEWVEIANHSRRSRSLRGWQLSDGIGHVYTFRGTPIPPGRTVRVHTGSGRDTPSDRYWGRHFHAWDNSGSTVRLSSPTRAVDSCRWRPGRSVKRC